MILSDVDGLFTADPRKDSTATLIPLIHDITEDIERRAGLSSTFEGTGGMATKVRAAKKVGEYGVATLILNGTQLKQLPEVLSGKPGGSLFLARERRLTSRKHGIAFHACGPAAKYSLIRARSKPWFRRAKAYWHQAFWI